MSDILQNDIKYLPGVGPARAQLLQRELGIATFGDLLHFFPFRYVDRSRFYSIGEIDSTSSYVQVRGRILRFSITGEGKAKRLIAVFTDGVDTVDLVFFKGIKWISEKLRPNAEYVIFGKPSVFQDRFNFVHPEIEPATTQQNAPSSMVGIYPSTEKLQNGGISQKVMAKLEKSLLDAVLPGLEETLPRYIIESNRLCDNRTAFLNIHFPQDQKLLSQAQQRLKFEELFLLELRLLRQKHVRMRGNKGISMPKVGAKFNAVFANIPFELTGAQKRVIKEFRADMMSGRQMNRLLQGDVGSGKTMVALLTAILAADNGYQACIMAPTEVLANQHYNGVQKLIAGTGVSVALLTGSTKAEQRRKIHKHLEDGSIDIIFGTHALIEKDVVFRNLGLAVIDEQHRFGVEQRSRLWSKSQQLPHILVMTATPIPRTLAMTLYGDLDVSVLDELPPGRKPINTIHITENRRGDLFNFMRREIAAGRQVFVVYPLIKESEKMDYKNLEEGYDIIREAFPAPEYRTAVVHGQQKAEDRKVDMDLFVSGRAHILVATSVIEVGVDVPNASVMVIESAERFGLSQLHQLRGRVGRGGEKSYCILMTGYKMSKESQQRIELMCSTQDGFLLAEADMRMRGPGDLQGTQQSGLPIDLHIANLGKDSPLLEKARDFASKVLDSDPALEHSENALLARRMREDGTSLEDFSRIS